MTNETGNEDLPALDNGQDYNDLLQDIVEYHIGQTAPVEPADQVCDVFKFGHCNRCDHPCKDYLENNGYR